MILQNRVRVRSQMPPPLPSIRVVSSLKSTAYRFRRMMHNHPSGDPSPSAADVRMTREIADVAKPLGITLHDHIIIGKSGHASLRGLRLI